MKFVTLELVKRVDALIAQRTAEAEAENAHVDAMMAQGREEWLEKYRDNALAYADHIVNMIEQGEPLTTNDPAWKNLSLYNGGRKVPKEPKIESLVTLKNLLTTVHDELVSSTALREMGFRDLNTLFYSSKEVAA